MSLNLCKSASSRDANWPLASLGYLSLVNFTSPGWSHNTLLLDNVLILGAVLFKIWQSFAALESPPCILAIHIGHVIAATYHSGISSLFARYFPFTHFLSLSLCLAARGLRVFGVSRLGLVLLVQRRHHAPEWGVYCLHRQSSARPSSSSERPKVEPPLGLKSVYVQSVSEASVYILSASDTQTGLVWRLSLQMHFSPTL